MRMIRLWKAWFTDGAPQVQCIDSYGSYEKLFTRVVWTDASQDVGFLISARRYSITGQRAAGSYASIFQGPFYESKLYEIKIEKMMIRDHHVLGLFEGFSI